MTLAAGAGAPAPPGGRGGGGPREGSLVLLIEDDADIAALMTQCLREVGYRPVRVTDGEEALALALGKGQRVALVLLDWWLPGALWGRPLLERLRARFGAPIVVISADPAALTEASAAGATDYLPKPFQLADLVHVVDEHCH